MLLAGTIRQTAGFPNLNTPNPYRRNPMKNLSLLAAFLGLSFMLPTHVSGNLKVL